MRKKFIDKVYMREVTDKVFHVKKIDEINGYIALKYVKEISNPLRSFCNGKKYIGLDKGFSILEYILLDKNYNCRVFFDNFNRPLCFYFDINNGCGIEDNVPWYDDLYLDVTMETPIITDGFYYIRLDDEKELKIAKKEGLIDEATYNMGYDVATSLMLELKNQSNEIVNRCLFDLFSIKKDLNLL